MAIDDSSVDLMQSIISSFYNALQQTVGKEFIIMKLIDSMKEQSEPQGYINQETLEFIAL